MRSPITISAPSSQRRHEAGDLVEVVGQVGVGHHDVCAARGREPGEVGAAVAAPGLDHHARARAARPARAESSSESLSTTTTSPANAHPRERRERGGHAGLDVLRLVQARDHDRHQPARPPPRHPRDGELLDDCAHGGRRVAWRMPSHAVITRGDGQWRIREMMLPRARLRRLRLPVPVHRRRRRALVSQPRRAPRAGGARGHLPDAAPVGSRRRRPTSTGGGAGRRGRSADGAVHGDGRRRILPPLVFGLGVLWHLLRHGRRYDVVHTCVVSLLLAARRGAAAAARTLRARGRLVRGLERLLLARLPRRRRGRVGAPSSACARACASARSASQSCTPRDCARRACAAR